MFGTAHNRASTLLSIICFSGLAGVTLLAIGTACHMYEGNANNYTDVDIPRILTPLAFVFGGLCIAFSVLAVIGSHVQSVRLDSIAKKYRTYSSTTTSSRHRDDRNSINESLLSRPYGGDVTGVAATAGGGGDVAASTLYQSTTSVAAGATTGSRRIVFCEHAGAAQWPSPETNTPDRKNGIPRYLFPLGDIYFQNVRSRVVIIVTYVFIFNTCLSLAIEGASRQLILISCLFLLLLAPAMMATFPNSGIGCIIVGWITMTAYHALQLYAISICSSCGWSKYAQVGVFIFAQQFGYLRMSLVAWSPRFLARAQISGGGEVEALQFIRYVKDLWRWRDPLRSTTSDGLLQRMTIAEQRESLAYADPSKDEEHYTALRRFVDRWVDLPFISIPQRRDWTLPYQKPSDVLFSPTKLPLPFVIVQWCTVSIMTFFLEMAMPQSLGGLHLNNGTGSGATGFAETLASAFQVTLSEMWMCVAIALGWMLVTMALVSRQIGTAVINVQKGYHDPTVEKICAPWRTHTYLGQQCFANFALALFVFLAAIVFVLVWQPLWGYIKSLDAFVIAYLTSFAISLFTTLLSRTLFGRILSDKSSVRHFRMAVMFSHILSVMSILGGFGDLSSRFYWMLFSIFLSFASPMYPLTSTPLAFLDHMHRAMWSLVLLNNDCTNPTKQVMCAAFAACEEMEHLARHVNRLKVLGDPSFVEAIPVRLADVGAHLVMPIHRHMVRYFVLQAVVQGEANEQLDDDTAFRYLRYCDRVVLRMPFERVQLPNEAIRATRRRQLICKWWLLLVLVRFPSLRSLRKRTLWRTTFARAPAIVGDCDGGSNDADALFV